MKRTRPAAARDGLPMFAYVTKRQRTRERLREKGKRVNAKHDKRDKHAGRQIDRQTEKQG